PAHDRREAALPRGGGARAVHGRELRGDLPGVGRRDGAALVPDEREMAGEVRAAVPAVPAGAGVRGRRAAARAAHRLPPAPARTVAVLEDIVDHTNVGAMFRSAAALGVDAVLVTPQCADPLYRRSIRVSMGTVFQVPWTRLPAWPREGVDLLHEAGFDVLALA